MRGKVTVANSGASHAEEPYFEAIPIRKSIDKSLLRPPTSAYRVGPGDQLDIEVAEDAETRSTETVQPDGILYYNSAGGINVKGMTIREVSKALAENLSFDYVDPIVTVNVAQADSQRYFIMGAVRQPGTYPLDKPTTLLHAIGTSEGLGVAQANNESEETVDLSRAIMIRNGKTLPVNFEALVEGGDLTQNVYIRPGDYIYLPSRQGNSVYVMGEVQRPGPITYDSRLTILSAIASAGGPTQDAVVTRAMIVRGGNNNPQVSVVDIQSLMRGQSADLLVKPGDIVWVPRTLWTNIRNYTETVLTTAAQTIAVQEGVFGQGGGARLNINAGQ